MNTHIVPGSITQVQKQSGKLLADVFSQIEMVVIFDSSGSMDYHDAANGKSRYDAACQELVYVQSQAPGKVAIISFSDNAQWCFNGVPEMLGMSTNLAGALKFAKQVDNPYIKFVVISDGEPNSRTEALEVAATLKGKISCVYVGPENGDGRAFLKELANQHNGTFDLRAFANSLSESILPMLEAK